MTSYIRLPNIDKSPFNLKKFGQVNADGYGTKRGSDRNVHPLPPPSLPPLDCLNRHRSFVNLFETFDVEADQDEGDAHGMGAHDPGRESLLGIAPQGDLFRRHSNYQSEYSRLLGNNTAALSFEAALHNSDLQVVNLAPQRSSTTSTTESRVSDTTSRRSRPSSRSSVDEGSLTETSYGLSSGRSDEWTQQSSKTVRRTRESKLFWLTGHRSVSDMSTTSSYMDKPLPAQPVEHIPELEAISVFTPDPQTLPSLPKLEKAKRGTRLGRTIMSTIHQGQNQPDDTLGMSPKSAQTPAAEVGDLTDSSSNSPLPKQKLKIGRRSRRHEDLSEEDAEIEEQVLLKIFSNLHSLTDLQSAACVNKVFYRVVKKHQVSLVSRALFVTSPPAWELRQIIKTEQKSNPFKIRSVQRDVATLNTLKAFIMMKCCQVCRPTTIIGLQGGDIQRKAEIDNALWRIWLFCKAFGKSSGRSDHIRAQMSWLDGNRGRYKDKKVPVFGMGNGNGCTIQELEDMSEMWTCLEVLLDGFKGREAEARRAGIFDGCIIEGSAGSTEQDYLNAWIYDILSLGPKAVLTLTSCSFDQAKVLGVTKWTPPVRGASRANFLKSVIQEVYRERLVAQAKAQAVEFERAMSVRIPHQAKLEQSGRPVQSAAPLPQGLRILTNIAAPVQSDITQTFSPNPSYRQSSAYDLSSPVHGSIQQSPMTSSSTNPTAFSSIAITPKASTRMGATLFPVQQQTSSHTRVPLLTGGSSNNIPLVEPGLVEVVDPGDKALQLLVCDMGFSEDRARQALAMSDTGSGIDVECAIEHLSADSKPHAKRDSSQPIELPCQPSSEMSLTGRANAGETEPPRSPVPPRSQKKKTMTMKRLSKHRKSFRQSTVLGVIVDNDEAEKAAAAAEAQENASDVEALTTLTANPTGSDDVASHFRLGQMIKDGLRSQNSVSSQFSRHSVHRKSSSTGAISAVSEGLTESLLSLPLPGVSRSTTVSANENRTIKTREVSCYEEVSRSNTVQHKTPKHGEPVRHRSEAMRKMEQWWVSQEKGARFA